MASRKTCDKCVHYTATDSTAPSYVHAGGCSLMGDSNDNNGVVVDINKAAGWDYESHKAGVYVGPKFGCIHWVKKA